MWLIVIDVVDVIDAIAVIDCDWWWEMCVIVLWLLCVSETFDVYMTDVQESYVRACSFSILVMLMLDLQQLIVIISSWLHGRK